jgi:hypothetical protein
MKTNLRKGQPSAAEVEFHRYEIGPKPVDEDEMVSCAKGLIISALADGIIEYPFQHLFIFDGPKKRWLIDTDEMVVRGAPAEIDRVTLLAISAEYIAKKLRAVRWVVISPLFCEAAHPVTQALIRSDAVGISRMILAGEKAGESFSVCANFNEKDGVSDEWRPIQAVRVHRPPATMQ